MDALRRQMHDAEARLCNLDEHLADGVLAPQDYSRASATQKGKIREVRMQLDELNAVKGEYYKFVQSGASIVANLGKAYRESAPKVQQQILGSIWLEILFLTAPIMEPYPTIRRCSLTPSHSRS